MKCYLINLGRAPERLARMQQMLDWQGVEFERVPAIDARNPGLQAGSRRSQNTGRTTGLVAVTSHAALHTGSACNALLRVKSDMA